MKNKRSASDVLFVIMNAALALLTGAAAGLMSPWIRSIREMSFVKYLQGVGLTLLLLYLAFFIQMMIHESGHLLFGLMTGYRFSSFRILGLMIKKEKDGRLALKRLKLSGTAGQCLMIPPDLKDGKMPYVLYNLGGSLMNLISAVLFIVLYLILRRSGISCFYLPELAMTGIYLALTNAVPHRAAVPNDGYNAVSLGKDPEAVRAFWTQLKVNQLSHEGVRLRDMPAEWFVVNEGSDRENGLISYLDVCEENRLMDLHRFSEARSKAEKLISGTSLPALYRALLSADIVFIDLLEKGKDTDMSALSEKTNAAILKQMRDYPSVLRTRYALELLSNSDRKRSDEVLKAFEKIAVSFPSQAEIETERELIGLAAARAGSAEV